MKYNTCKKGARFTLPTIDVDTITISYPDAFSLMEHLSFMGEGTAGKSLLFSLDGYISILVVSCFVSGGVVY